MNKELLKKKEAVMNAVCEFCRWPLSAGEDEEVLYEEHCNHCPVALAVDALCEALRPEGMIDGSKLTEDAKELIKYDPEAVDFLAKEISAKTDMMLLQGKFVNTNARRLSRLTPDKLAEEIYYRLSNYKSRDALLKYLMQEAKE